MGITVIQDSTHLSAEISNATGRLSVLDFTAKWCGPCKFISPEFDRLSDKYSSVKFFKVDVDECSDIAQEYNIRSMPTFVFIKNSKEVDRFSGADVSKLEATIGRYGSLDSFTGSGYTLNNSQFGTSNTQSTASSSSSQGGIGGWIGSFVSSVTGSATSTISANSSPSFEDQSRNEECEQQAKRVFEIDKREPTCKVQVRLLDGKRITVVLNNSRTVEDLRQYVSIARPSYADIPFLFYTGHPAKSIEDEAISLEDANLANAVVLIQLKK